MDEEGWYQRIDSPPRVSDGEHGTEHGVRDDEILGADPATESVVQGVLCIADRWRWATSSTTSPGKRRRGRRGTRDVAPRRVERHIVDLTTD
jgi:hypothetical protein